MNGGPIHLELISEYEFDTRIEAERAEGLIHSMLLYYHFKHEWFRLSQDELKVVDKVLVDLLAGACHYHEKQYFISPELTIEEILTKSSIDIFDPNFERMEVVRAKFKDQ